MSNGPRLTARIVLVLTLCALQAEVTARGEGPSTGPAWHPVPGHLVTRWAKDVDPAAPLPEYPRPQMVRRDWLNLNGLWEYALTDQRAAAPPAVYDGQVLVPFPIESALSGVKRPVSAQDRLFCHRTFIVPTSWAGQTVLLHFGAVDYEAAVSVNGREVGRHVGGYTPFEFDVTPALRPGQNDLLVNVYDATSDDQPIGKQRTGKGVRGIWYTACTGIWQTVWLEPVPATHVTSLKLVPDVDGSALRLTVAATGDGTVSATATATADGKAIGAATGGPGAELTVPIAAPHLWTPDDPYLYSLHVSLRHGDQVLDAVDGYFAMRKVSLGKDAQGHERILLNNRFVFERGVLDQGYWPDGIYTAPTDAALQSDVDMTKTLGFNLSRKHAKVEPDRWYYWCDRQGLLVWQDMPQAKSDHLPEPAKAAFKRQLAEEVTAFANHPSIIVWTTFNEGWGEHDVEPLVDMVRQMDPTRLVNNASGWTDVPGVGDLRDTHHYPAPACEVPTGDRASVDGEFGGLGMRVAGHLWAEPPRGHQGPARDGWKLTRNYQGLIEQAYRLRDERSMSAYVYTQLTDVENETNGLLTYDRDVVKPDVAIVAAANAGRFVPLPPNPHPDVLPSAADEPGEWRYTTDQPGVSWSAADFDDRSWTVGRGGFGHGVGNPTTPWKTADIWLRRTATLPLTLPPAIDVLAYHDDDVQVYVNGIAAAAATGAAHDYERLPMSPEARAALKPGGPNVVAVHCHQTTGRQFVDVGLTAARQ